MYRFLEGHFAPTRQRPVNIFGITFKNPVGLAAGYDKDGLAWRGLESLGFGHVELGTVTPKPQFGNPTPRIFRLPEEEAIINRMGFPGRGAEFLEKRLVKARERTAVIGVNIGKNKDTPNELAYKDYLYLMHRFYHLADYLAINISSPNTIGLRDLQGKEALSELLQQISNERDNLQKESGRYTPILVKLAPDLSDQELDDALDEFMLNNIDGVIACNTTTSRDGIQSDLRDEDGGLSGAPLRVRSFWMTREIYKRTSGMLPIISVGGIASVDDAKERIDAGAALVQVYTGLIYKGPGLAKEIIERI